jgi:hypothetical protein
MIELLRELYVYEIIFIFLLGYLLVLFMTK